MRNQLRMILILVFMALASGGCANTTPYAEGFIGYKTRSNDGLESCSRENSGIRLGVERRLSNHWVVKGEYVHISHLLCGRPFNKDADESTDYIGGVIRYEW